MIKTMKISKLIKNLNLDYCNPDITDKNFPDQPRKDLGPVELMKIDKEMTTKEILDQMKQEGYEPANSAELLEWARDWKGKDDVMALGSQWCDADGYLRALNLWGYGGRRGLNLCYCILGSGWVRGCVFARRKVSPALGTLDSLPSLELRILELEKFKEKVE